MGGIGNLTSFRLSGTLFQNPFLAVDFQPTRVIPANMEQSLSIDRQIHRPADPRKAPLRWAKIFFPFNSSFIKVRLYPEFPGF
jgi:hypothetical protein